MTAQNKGFSRSTSVSPSAQLQPGERVTQHYGTFIGFVKENRDALKQGRLKVWIPEISGDQTDEGSWLTVTYASPFAGSTPFRFNGNNPQEFQETQTSYGFWFVPPDINAQVLVTFIRGDVTKGVYFACLQDRFMNQMMPGFAASIEGEHYGPDSTGDDIPLPTGEYNKNVGALDGGQDSGRTITDPLTEKRPINKYKAGGIRDQGLIYDHVRGINNSSAQREAPSQVYGITTPGPEDESVPEVPLYEKRPSEVTSPGKPLPVNGVPKRKGGHSFVMDDHPETEYIALKTRSGAQIRIDETNGVIYLNNRDGSAWIELSESGHVDIYGAKSISMRTEEDLNIRADRDINIEAGRNINVKAAKDYVSKEDVVKILTQYANTHNQTLPDIFDEQEKREYVNDFPEIRLQLESGELDVDQAWTFAMETAGYPVTGKKNLKFEPRHGTPNASSLSSIELMDLIRGSNNIGEGFGTGGNIKIQANGDTDVYTEFNTRITTLEGDMDVFVGEDTNITSGRGTQIATGLGFLMTAGMNMSLLAGTGAKMTFGGDLDLTVMNHTRATLRGDVQVRLEGLKLAVEAVPTWFTDNGREKFTPEHVIHDTKIKLANVGAQVNTYNLEALQSIRLAAQQTLVGQAAAISMLATTAFVGAGAAATLASGTSVPVVVIPQYINLPWAKRAAMGEIAKFSQTPELYSKSNVLPLLKADGNKEYALTYHRQVVESIVPRMMTREPCVEHENTGKNEERNQLFAEHLKFRIV